MEFQTNPILKSQLSLEKRRSPAFELAQILVLSITIKYGTDLHNQQRKRINRTLDFGRNSTANCGAKRVPQYRLDNKTIIWHATLTL